MEKSVPKYASFYQGMCATKKGLILQNQPSTEGFHKGLFFNNIFCKQLQSIIINKIQKNKGPGTGQIDWCRNDFAHLEESFLYKDVHFQQCFLSVIISCLLLKMSMKLLSALTIMPITGTSKCCDNLVVIVLVFMLFRM